MEHFPFTEAEWNRINETSSSLLNAILADDEALSASWLQSLIEDLDKLRSKQPRP